MAYRTLGDLRSELLSRLGMGAMGASGGANATLCNSFLRNGQAQLYWMQQWRHLTDYQDKTVGTSQNLIDYPGVGAMVAANTAARNKRILRLERVVDSQYTKLDEGIRTDDWNTMDTESYPCRFERFAQILLWPKADQVYTVRVWFVADLGAFSEDNDTATLDDEMVFLHALANAKAHYRQPDAPTYQGQLNTLLASLRGQSFSNGGVYRRDERPPAEPKPVVV